MKYKELFRNSDDYLFEQIYYKGEVIQVLGDATDGWTLRVNVTKGRYGFWEDTVILYYTGTERFLEDDIVEFVASYTGPYTYESVMGGDITIPGFLLVQQGQLRLVR